VRPEPTQGVLPVTPLALYFGVRPEPTQETRLIMPLVLLGIGQAHNCVYSLEMFANDKHSSLFSSNVGGEEKKFYGNVAC